MTFEEILDQAVAMLERRGRVTYRALKRQFNLDDDALDDLKVELIEAQQVAIDEGGTVLVWTGGPATAVVSASALGRAPLSYTPKHLAEKILTSRSALEGECKQVTVLFCDLANSTALAERLGSEAMHSLLNRFFELGLTQVHRYEGTINQFLGDGFMALFGAPIAHEDHARRAALAALDIHQGLGPIRSDLERQHGVEFALRIGLNTGSVVVGSIGDNLRMDYTAIGDTTNLAARMQQLASPGEICVAEATYRVTKETFQWQEVGPRMVKGKTEPVRVYKLLSHRAVKSQFEVVAQRGLTRFVGRNSELQQLLAAWETARQGHGQVVSIMGEAGIGKSRLLYELKHGLRQADARYLEGSCFTYGDVISYFPFLEIVKAILGLAGDESEGEAKHRMGHRLSQLGLEPASIAPYLHNLLTFTVEDASFPTLPSYLLRQRTVDALKTLVIAEAHHHPLGLILEDVHWIDKASEEVLTTLVEAMAAVPLLVVLVYRPEYLQGWLEQAPHTCIALLRLPSASSAEMVRAILTKPYAARVSLEPLSPEQSTALAQALLGTATIPPELEHLIITKTEGNPLFVEELTRSLLESGALVQQNGSYVLTTPVAALDIPTTVQGVLLARIDRLHEELKEVLQVAAVIGRVFSYPLLARVVERLIEPSFSTLALESVLGELESLEFIYPTGVSPQQEYSFKHVLTQEAVYKTLLRPKREECHERIGQALEALYPDRLEEHYEVLAYHYSRSANKDKAVEYLNLANQKAAKASAMEEAKRYFDEAMKVLDTMLETKMNQQRRISLLVNQVVVMLLLFKFQEYYKLLTRYESIAVGLGNPGLLGAYYGRMGHCEWSFGHLDRAIQSLAKGVELCEAAGNYEGAGHAYMQLQWSYLYRGDYDQVLLLKEPAARTFERLFNLRYYIFALSASSLAYSFLGRWDDAIKDGQKALRVAEEFSDNSLISFAAWTISWAYTHKGDLARALEYGELSVEKAPTPADKVWSQGFLACASCRAGEPRRAAETLAAIIPISRAAGFRGSEIFAGFLSEGYWLAGDYDKARQTLEEYLEIIESSGMRFYTGFSYRLLGEIALETNPTQVEEPLAAPHFEKSIAILREIKAENELALAYAGYGQLHKQQGSIARAREYFTKALEIFECLGTLIEPDKVRQGLAQLPEG
jgi:class 3 adenylate cyclase/tetratricopeptide (TPR) repeat protein